VASNGSSTSSGPLVGLTAYCERAAFGVWDVEAVLLPRSYTDMVADAGGVPVLLPPRPEAAAAVDRLDAVLLAGGADIAADRYGSLPDPRAGAPRPDRDATELAVLERALARGIPVLGVCRGAQLLNVLHGGDLHQDLGEAGMDARAHRTDAHAVHTGAGTLARRALGRSDTVVSWHHQAVRRVGSGLRVSARAADGLPEAVEVPGRRFAVGLQWHPEMGERPGDQRVAETLVEAACAA
jgi:gamma-glutamyl-gamma-aminobutyrate hydrolase PuuD